MSKPRDPVDAWLETDVELLHPTAGAFERVSRRARRRKAIQATATVAGAAVIIAGFALAPNLASFLPGTSTSQSVTGASSSPPHSHPSGRPATARPALRPSARPGAALPGAGPAAPQLRPTSVTFIGAHTGAVLGQAGTRSCPAGCAAIAGTADYGGSWTDVGAPAAGPPDGSSGVSQLRFLNFADGWAFGPSLWYTTNGGVSWAQSSLTAGQAGARVTDVEALDGQAYALVGTCTGAGADYARNCSSFTLYRSAAGTDAWHPVGGAAGLTATGPAAQGGGAAASLVLAGAGHANPAADAGYLLTPSGSIVGGSIAGASWHTISADNLAGDCSNGPAAANGQPTQELIASPGPGTLYAVCTISAAEGNTVSQWSAGRGWHVTGNLRPGSGLAPGSLAAEPGGILIIGWHRGIELSADSGASWQLVQASPGGTGSQAGFSFAGMTSPSLGVAVPADASLGELFVTTDGGRSWSPSRV